jgi:superfamily II DNA or RNA helicase
MNELVKYRYQSYILDRFIDLKNSGKQSFNNFDLAKIFEFFSAIKLSEEFNDTFLEYNDIDPTFKEDNYMSKNDTGIDLSNLKDSIVQCKLRKKYLGWEECGTFFASQNTFDETLNQHVIKWKKLIITRNSESSLSDNLYHHRKRFLDKTYPINDIINYCEELVKNPPKEIVEKINEQFELRDYQKEAIDVIKNNKNSIINLPTGTGKNMIIIHSFEKNKKYLILVPRIILMEQLKTEIIKYKPELKNKIQLIGDGNNEYNDKKNITICVYNSVSIIEPFAKSFDKIYIDEAHHIYTPEIYRFENENEEDEEEEGENEEEDDKEDEIKNTTKYTTIIKSFKKYDNNVYLSATIDSMNDFTFYKKDIRDMITKSYLCDYNVIIPIFPEDPSDRSVCKYLIEKYRNIIVYCDSRKDGQKITKIMNEILPKSTEYLDCNTSKKKRDEILKKYKEGNIGYLVNVRILVEGFDAPITKGVVFLHLPSSKTTLIQIIGRALRLHKDKTIANVILPYSINEEGKNINNFLSVIANNDSRLKETYFSKKNGGYFDVQMIKSEEGTGEEDDNLKEDVNLKFEIIYKNMGSKHVFTPSEKGEILLKYVDDNKRMPPKKEIIKLENGDEVTLGSFWHCLKQGDNKEVLEYLKGKNEIIKKAHEEYLEYKKSKEGKRELNPKEKGDLLLKYVNDNKRLPPVNYIHQLENGDEVRLGAFWDRLKQNNPEILDYLIIKNEIIKKEYDKFLEFKKYKEGKRELSAKEKGDLLLKYVNKNKMLPLQKEIVKLEDGTEFKIGGFWGILKQGFNKDILEELISKNDIIKKAYEEYLEYKKSKEGNRELTPLEKGDLLLKYVDDNNRLPPAKEIIKLDDKTEVKIGSFWDSLKSGNSSKEVLEDLLSKNEIIKKAYEDYLEYKKAKEGKRELSAKEKGDLFLKYVDEKKRLPPKKEIIKLDDKTEFKIGQFWDSLKSGQCKEVLEYLISKNEIIKKEYEEYFKKKKAKEGKKDYTPKEKGELLLKYVDEKKRLPPHSEIIKLEDGTEFKIGGFWAGLKQGDNKEVLEYLKGKNEIIKKAYEEYLKNKKEKEGTNVN